MACATAVMVAPSALFAPRGLTFGCCADSCAGGAVL